MLGCRVGGSYVKGRKPRHALCPWISGNKNLDGFLYKARPQAPCADFDPLGRAIDQGPNTLKIWTKYPVGLIIRMTDVVPSHPFFTAN